MDVSGLLMDILLPGLLEFHESKLPDSPDEMVDDLPAHVFGAGK
jgi:hypothetical protein